MGILISPFELMHRVIDFGCEGYAWRFEWVIFGESNLQGKEAPGVRRVRGSDDRRIPRKDVLVADRTCKDTFSLGQAIHHTALI